MATVVQRIFVCVACSTWLSIACPAWAASNPPPVEAFAALPAVSGVVLSPNGALVAWSDRTAADERAVVYDLDHKKVLNQFGVSAAQKLRDLAWADDETVLVELSQTDKHRSVGEPVFEVFRFFALPVAGGPGHLLLMSEGDRRAVTSATLLATHASKPGTIIMETLDRPSRSFFFVSAVFEVDTRTGKGQMIEQGSFVTTGWALDADGRPVATSQEAWPKDDSSVFVKRAGAWKEAFTQTDDTHFKLAGLTVDGGSVVALALGQGDKHQLWRIPLDGSAASVLYAEPDVEVESVVHDSFTGRAVAVRLGGLNQELRWIDQSARMSFERVARAFKGKQVQVTGRSADGTRAIARVQSPSDPPVYYLVDFNKKTADIVGEEYPALAGAALGTVRTLTYKARDGTEIPAYLTLPPAVDSKSLPLVVLPHGGPAARDDYTFDWLSQFLASRGYAVLQPQFRGSTGFGKAFRQAGFKQWGRLMQDDVTDGVKALIDQGVADPRRVAIVGASYGGYVALAGVAFTPDLYRCAASVGGISDLPNFLGATSARYRGPSAYGMVGWELDIGSVHDKNVIERSPARAVDRVKAPVLLIHGLDDTVVPVAQSEKMERELKKLGKPVKLVELQGEDHWLSRSASRVQVMAEIEKFLAANL